ncbi:MAG: hypothetical protein ACLQG5_05740 [Methanobacterium sp.]
MAAGIAHICPKSVLICFGGLCLWYFSNIPAIFSIIISLLLVYITIYLIKTLSMSINWNDSHRLAVIYGGLLASMLAGFWVSGIVLPIDFIGKIIFNVSSHPNKLFSRDTHEKKIIE